MSELSNKLLSKGVIRSDAVIEAFANIDRAEFVPRDFSSGCYADIPLPIGFGQTISQPSTVGFMLELLELKGGEKVLDVGSGSGWTVALLASIVGQNGRVTAVEFIKELVEMGRKNVDEYAFVRDGRVEFHLQDGYDGWQQNAPYDAILVNASSEEVPNALKTQLKVGGRMVIPIGNVLCRFTKESPGEYKKEEFPGFEFVPLVKRG